MDNLIGISAGDWWQLLRENRFAVAPKFISRAGLVTFLSLRTAYYRRKEDKFYAKEVADTPVKAPVFIMGHWRSGTTLLHYLMAQDEQFTYPTIFQTMNPHTFLCREDQVYQKLADAPPRERAMDNMRFHADSPGEDEFALCAASLRSPLISWSFPRREAHYDRYLTFHDVPQEDVERWKSAFMTFLKKIAWKHKRPLLIKSPAHTARIRLLLEMFPQARFVHIRRNPYKVFQSTQRLFHKGVIQGYLQGPPSEEQVTDGILRRYVEMYDAFFEDKELVPEGRFYEIKFEELIKDKLGLVAKIYEGLNLPGFEAALPAMQRYVDSVAEYKKNKHPELPERLRQRVAATWQRNFEVWGYSA